MFGIWENKRKEPKVWELGGRAPGAETKNFAMGKKRKKKNSEKKKKEIYNSLALTIPHKNVREIIKSICTAGGPRHRHHRQGTATKAQRDGLAPILGQPEGRGWVPPKGRVEVGWTPGTAEGPRARARPSPKTPPGTLPKCAGVVEGEKVALRVPSWMAAGEE